MGIPQAISTVLSALFRHRAELAVEPLALRPPRAVLQRSVQRPRLRRRDRIFWTWVLRIWSRWKSALSIVQPATVIRWHRPGFERSWRGKSRRRRNGRPRVDPEIRRVLRRSSGDNPTWGVPRIQSALVLRGDDVADSTVAKSVVRTSPPIANVADCLENPRNRACGDGLLPRAARDVSRALLRRRLVARSPARGALHRACQAVRRLARAAKDRGGSFQRRAALSAS